MGAGAAGPAEPKSPAKTGPSSMDDDSKGSTSKSPGRRRMTEREEDEQYLKQTQQTNDEEDIPRLTKEQTANFISTHPMRPYQVEGLNWLIR